MLHLSCVTYSMFQTPHELRPSCRLCATGQKRSARWRRLMSGGVTFPGHMSVISGLRATQERRHSGAMSAAHSDPPSRDGWESEGRADGTGPEVSTQTGTVVEGAYRLMVTSRHDRSQLAKSEHFSCIQHRTATLAAKLQLSDSWVCDEASHCLNVFVQLRDSGRPGDGICVH